MHPFVKYPGGKAKELPLIQKYLPKQIHRYFEPFVGGGAVFLGLSVDESYINDYSKDLILLYVFLKQNDDEFRSYLLALNNLWKKTASKKLKRTELPTFLSFEKYEKYLSTSLKRKETTIANFSKKGVEVSAEDKKKIIITANKTSIYMLIRDLYNDSSNEKLHIAGYYFMREYCYSSMFRFSNNGKFNVPYGGMSYNDKNLDSKIEYMFSTTLRSKLLKAEINNYDFEVFLKQYSFKDNDFIFLDPPYDSEFSTYDQNNFDKNEQKRLKTAISTIKAKWMLVIKKTDFIESLYHDFYVYEYDKNYNVSFKNRNDREVKHLLITNYDIRKG